MARLGLNLEFTKDIYARDETVTVRVTLTNTGTVPLHGIIANCNRAGFSYELNGTGPGWGDLAGDGVTVAPNSTHVVVVTEPMPAAACDFGYAGVDADTNPSDHDEAAVPGQVGDATGMVADAEIGMAGVRVVLVGENGCPAGDVTTDRNGSSRSRRCRWVGTTCTYVVGHFPSFVYIELEEGLAPAPAPTLPNCGGPSPPHGPRRDHRPAPRRTTWPTPAPASPDRPWSAHWRY